MRIAAKAVTVLVTALLFGAVTNSVQAAEQKPTQESKRSTKTTVVQPGDSLSLIAGKHKTTYQRLFYANRKVQHPDIIHAGQKLRIPAKNEKLKKRPLPGEVSAVPQPVVTASYHTPAQQPTVVSTPRPAPTGGDVWDRLAACESGGNWQINTGNGYYGGLQFSATTWQSVGGSGLPHQHSRDEQIRRGKILQARSGWGQWPACAAKLGLL